MSIRNLHWSNANCSRQYPLADSASARSIAGDLLPPDILADMNVRFPETLGRFAFVAAVCVTERLVSVTIEAAVNADDTAADGFQPVGVVTLPRDTLEPYRHYPLQPQAGGAGGWLIFGAGAASGGQSFSGRFDGPPASLLAPRACRAYRLLPVTNLGRLYDAVPLTEVVRLQGADPIEVVPAEYEVAGVLRTVALVRLKSRDPAQGTAATGPTVFQEFAGPCGGRPESGTCRDPAPVEFLNAVAPDCNGNLTIEFLGCARIAKVVQQCGVVIDCGLGLAEACLQDTLPASDGVLRNEYPNQCDDVSLSASGGAAEQISLSLSTPDTASLPVSEDFEDSLADGWDVMSGSFSFVTEGADVTYSTEAGGALRRNLSVFGGAPSPGIGLRVTTEVAMLSGPAGARHNAGIVINQRPHLAGGGRTVYFLAELDYDEQEFRIRRWNGSSFIREPAFVVLTNLRLDRYYRIVVEITAGAGDTVDMVATVTALSGAALTATISLNTSSFYPDSGRYGLHADRSAARFNTFALEVI